MSRSDRLSLNLMGLRQVQNGWYRLRVIGLYRSSRGGRNFQSV